MKNSNLYRIHVSVDARRLLDPQHLHEPSCEAILVAKHERDEEVWGTRTLAFLKPRYHSGNFVRVHLTGQSRSSPRAKQMLGQAVNQRLATNARAKAKWWPTRQDPPQRRTFVKEDSGDG